MLVLLGMGLFWLFVLSPKKPNKPMPPAATTKPSAAPTARPTPSQTPRRSVEPTPITRSARQGALGSLKAEPEVLVANSDLYAGVLSELVSDQRNVFLTGKAGTGKSTLLKQFVKRCGSGVAIVAPTGIAAINVGGETIHRFFGFPIHYLQPDDVPFRRSAPFWTAINTLVIDEVSMVRADLMRAIDLSLRKNRRIDRPFGGVRVVLVGDLGQLPPVVAERELDQALRDQFGGPYFHNYAVLSECEWRFVELRHVFRQEEGEFVGMLDAIRDGNPPSTILEQLNRRRTNDEPSERAIILTLTNKRATEINDARLEEIAKPTARFTAVVEGEFPKEFYPTEKELILKVGARVMLLKNDSSGRWVNGTIATVSRIGAAGVWVRIGRDEYELHPAGWEKFGYEYDAEAKRVERKVTGTFKQLPLRLAWAITVHKSQGLSLDVVHVDLPRAPWAHGQLYVALSRCRSLQGLTLSREITMSDIIVDAPAFSFAREVLLTASAVAGVGIRGANGSFLGE